MPQSQLIVVVLTIATFAVWPLFIYATYVAVKSKNPNLKRIVSTIWIMWMVSRTIAQFHYAAKARKYRRMKDIVPDYAHVLWAMEEPERDDADSGKVASNSNVIDSDSGTIVDVLDDK